MSPGRDDGEEEDFEDDAQANEVTAGADVDVSADARLAAELQKQITSRGGMRQRQQVQYNAEKVDNWAEVEHARTRRAPAKKNLPVRRAPARAGSGKASARRGRGRGSDTDDDDDDGDSDDDGSDYDGGGRSGGRKRGSSGRRPTARARKATAGGRRSGRAAAGGVSYADDAGASDIYFSDEESDAEAAAAAAAAAAKPASLKDRQLLNLGLSAAPPQVEKLLTSRPAAGGGVEYLVKWKVRAHMHSTWVAEAEVAAERGGAARIARLEARMAAAPDEEPIDPQFLEVERVVAAATGPFGPARKQVRVLLCKWRSLPYASCTWELASSVNDDDALARFEQRERPPIERRLRKHTVGRQAVQPWAEAVVSPPYRAGNTLRPYQLEGLNWLSFSWHEGRNVILADEMGLGKTVQSVSLLHYLYSQQQCRGPFLVVAPLSCVPHWTREIEAWTDLDCVLYHGDRESRAALHEFEWRYAPGLGVDGLHKFNVVVTTFEMILEKEASLKSVHWNCMIVDEAHRLKNASSRLSQVLSSYSIDHTVLLTGTPLQNSKEELFTLLNFVASDEFPSVDNFDRRFGALDSAESVERLNTAIKPFLLRRMKADVEKSVPPKEETIVEVELTGLQKKYYRAIYERNTHFLNKGAKQGNTVNLMNVMMELRKCCNHPYLVNGVEDKATAGIARHDAEELTRVLVDASGKLVLMDKLLPKLQAGGHKVLVFSQMVRCLDILEDYLKQRRYLYERLDGNVRGNDRQSAIDRFSKKGSDRFVFLLCTRAGGLGINLTAADTVIIYDSDWNPQNDIQAQARCHRIGQTQAVKVYRLITRNTYEMEMFRKASLKLGLDHAVLGGIERGGGQGADGQGGAGGGRADKLSAKEIDSLLKHGAYHVFGDEDGADDASARFNEADIDTILERSTMVKQHSLAEAGSTFSKATFVSSGGAGARDVNVDDDDFWIKIGLKPQEEEVVEELGDRRRRAVSRFGMEQKPQKTDFEDSDAAGADDDNESGDGREKSGRPHAAGAWSKRARDIFVGGLLRFGPTRLRRCELATPKPGSEGTCHGKSQADQRAITSGFGALCLTMAGATVRDYEFASAVIDPAATTAGTDGVLREQSFRDKAARNADVYLEKMQAACDLNRLVLGNPAFAEAAAPPRDEPPFFAREGVLAYRLATGMSAEAAVAAEAKAAADGDDNEALTAESEARKAYVQRLQQLNQLRVPELSSQRSAPCEGWGASEDRMLLIGVWAYGLNSYELIRKDSILAKVATLTLIEAEELADHAQLPHGCTAWPSRDALDRRFRALLKSFTGDRPAASKARAKAQPEGDDAPRRVPASQSKAGGPRPQPATGGARAPPVGKAPRAAASAARDRLAADAADDDFEPRAKAPARAPAPAQPPPPPALPVGPPPDPELKKAVTAAMLKFGELDAAADGGAGGGSSRAITDVVALEMGRTPSADGAEMRRVVELVRLEWEHASRSDDADKAKKAQGKLTRLSLCNTVRALARAPPRAPLAVGRDDGLPAWWASPRDDAALLRGSARYGFNAYAEMFADRELFPDMPAAEVAPPDKSSMESLFKRIRKIVATADKKPAAAGAASKAGGGGGKRPLPPAARPAAAPPRAQPALPPSGPPKKQFAKDWGSDQPGAKRPAEAEPTATALPPKKQHSFVPQ